MHSSLPDWCYAHKRATEKQKGLLRRLGIAFSEQTLTKRQASELISRHLPRRAEAQTSRRGDGYEQWNEAADWARRADDGWGPGPF